MRNRRLGQAFNRTLRMENLERRIVLAGNVTVNSTLAGTLLIAGDAADNSITITPSTHAGNFIITGNMKGGAATTVNNVASVDTFGLPFIVTSSILINMSNGDDQVIVLGITTPADMQIDGDGDGVAGPAQNNDVEIGIDPLGANAIHPVTINGPVTIANMSTIDIENTFVNAAVISTITATPVPANNSAANNVFTIKRSTFTNDLALAGGDLKSTFTIDQVFAQDTTIAGGLDDDTIAAITHAQFDSLGINLGAGNDTITTIANDMVLNGDLNIDLGAGHDSMIINAVSVTNGNFLLNLGAGVANQVDQVTIGNTSTVVVDGNFTVTMGANNKTFVQDDMVVTGAETINGGGGVASVTLDGSDISGNLIVDYATVAGAAGGIIHVESTTIGGAATLSAGANGDTIVVLDSTVDGTLIADGGAGADSITIGDAANNATTAVTAGEIDIIAGAGIDAVRIGFTTSPVVSRANLIVNLGAEADTLVQIFTTVLGAETVTHTGALGSVGLSTSGVGDDLTVNVAEAAFAASDLNVVGNMTVDAGTVNMLDAGVVGIATFTGGDVNQTGITINRSTFAGNLYLRGRATGQNHMTLLNSVVAQSAVVNKDNNGVTIATQQNVIAFNTNSINQLFIDGGTDVDNVTVLASVSQAIFASLGTADDSMNISNFICPTGQLDGGTGTNTLLQVNTNFVGGLLKVNFS